MQLTETRQKNVLILTATVAGLVLLQILFGWVLGGFVTTPILALCAVGQVVVLRQTFNARGWQRLVRPAWIAGLVLAVFGAGASVATLPVLGFWSVPLLTGILFVAWLFLAMFARELPEIAVWLFDKTLELPTLIFRGSWRGSAWLARLSRRTASRTRQAVAARRLARQQALSPEERAFLETKHQLDALVQDVKHDPKATGAITKKVSQVRDALLDALPKAADSSEQYDVHTLRQIAADYFPKTLEYFLQTDTPAALFRSQVIEADKTAETIFLEQLAILEGAIGDILVTVHNDSTQDLIANARFLRERFRKSDFESLGKN